MRSVSHLVVLLLLQAALTSPLFANSTAPAKPIADWTVLYYFATDNNIEQWGLIDVNETEAAGSNAKVNIVAQIDRSPDYDSSDGNWTDTRRYLMTYDTDPTQIHSLRLDTLPPLGELNTADPQTLIDFIIWGIDNFPAQHYALFMWDHGDGWYKKGANDDVLFKGIGVDETSDFFDAIDVANGELAFALQAIKTHLGRKLDLLGFDACLMQMWEVHDAIASYADYMVASEEGEYLEGWNHAVFLQALKNNPTMTGRQLGIAIADAAIDNSTLNTTSVVDLSMAATVTDAVNTFGCQLIAAHANYITGPIIDDWRGQLAISGQIYIYLEHTDFYRFAELIQADTRLPGTLRTAAGSLMSALNTAVVHNRVTVTPDYTWSHGIAVYYPRPNEYYNPRYDTLAIASTTSWARFLGSSVTPQPRGDANSDGAVDISDAVYLIAFIFSGGPAPAPLFAGDPNCDDAVDISDAVYLIAFIFSGGAAPCGGC